MCRRCVGGVLAVFSGGGGVWGRRLCAGGGILGGVRGVFGGFLGFFGGFRGFSREVLGFSGDFVGLVHHCVPVLWRVGVGYRKLVFGWSVFGEGVWIGGSGPGLGC